MRATNFYLVYSKIFVVHQRWAVKNSFIIYVRVSCTGCFILNGIVVGLVQNRSFIILPIDGVDNKFHFET